MSPNLPVVGVAVSLDLWELYEESKEIVGDVVKGEDLLKLFAVL